jgi:protein-S-isoprenylcysteine O-methyltransferase Ste14
MNTETTFQIVAILLILSGMSISITFRHRAHKAGQQSGDKILPRQEEKTFVYWLRSIAGTALILSTLAYLIKPAWVAWAQLPLPPGLRWVGAFIGLIGLPLMYWVFTSLGRNITHTTAIRREHTLVTSGPYRWVRHPLYSTGMLNFMGFSLLTANWFIFLMAMLAFAALLLRTTQEEARLIEKFGAEYRQYMQRSGRFLPRI